MRTGLCSSASVFLWTALSRREYLVSRCIGFTKMSISLRRLQSRCVSHHWKNEKKKVNARCKFPSQLGPTPTFKTYRQIGFKKFVVVILLLAILLTLALIQTVFGVRMEQLIKLTKQQEENVFIKTNVTFQDRQNCTTLMNPWWSEVGSSGAFAWRALLSMGNT